MTYIQDVWGRDLHDIKVIKMTGLCNINILSFTACHCNHANGYSVSISINIAMS